MRPVVLAPMILAAVMLPAQQVGASAITNGSFETGDFTGWTVHLDLAPTCSRCNDPIPAGSADVLSGLPMTWAPEVEPIAGTELAVLGTPGHPVTGGFHTVSASQVLTLDAGTILSGWSAFYDQDDHDSDRAWVRVLNASDQELARLWSAQSAPVVDGHQPIRGLSPWTEWTWAAPAAGVYTLELGVSGPEEFASYGLYDAIRVPEPSSVALLVLGGVGLGIVRRRRR